MAAIVTTPATATVDSLAAVPYATTQPSVTTTSYRANVSIRSVVTNVLAARVAPGLPIKRWDGTSWVTLFRPRY